MGWVVAMVYICLVCPGTSTLTLLQAHTFTSLLLASDNFLVLDRKTQACTAEVWLCTRKLKRPQGLGISLSTLPWPAAVLGLLGASLLSVAGGFLAVSSSSSERSPASGSSKSRGQKERRQRSDCGALLGTHKLEAEAAITHA